MSNLKTIFQNYNSKLNELESVQRDIADHLMETSHARGVIEVDYNKDLVKNYFQQSPFYSYLKMKGRETATNSVEVGFRYKTKKNLTKFMAEGAEIPAYAPGDYMKKSQMVSELAYPFSISDKAAKGISLADLKQIEIEDGIGDIASTIDNTLLKGKATRTSEADNDPNSWDGLNTLIDDASSSERHAVDLNNAQITLEDVDSLCQDLLNDGGNPSLIVTTPAITRRLKELQYAQLRQYNTQEIVLGYNAISYILPSGRSVPILPDENLTPYNSSGVAEQKQSLYLLDENSLYIKTLLNNEIVEFAKTNFTQNYAIRKMTTFFCDAIFKNGKIDNIDSHPAA